MKISTFSLLLPLSIVCSTSPLGTRQACNLPIDPNNPPQCVDNVLTGFNNSNPITTLDCEITLSVTYRGSPWFLAPTRGLPPARDYESSFESSGPGEPLRLRNTFLSLENQPTRYVLVSRGGRFWRKLYFSTRLGRPGFRVRLGYKCVAGEARMIVLPHSDNCQLLFSSHEFLSCWRLIPTVTDC